MVCSIQSVLTFYSKVAKQSVSVFAKENIKLLLVSNKGHNPNYTEDAVKYLGELSSNP